MELWVFDSKGERIECVIDLYSQLKVISRYDSPGEIMIAMPQAAISGVVRLKPGMIVWPKGMDEAYIMESVTMNATPSGIEIVSRGRTQSQLFERRVLPDALYFSGKAGIMVRQLIEHVFLDPARSFKGLSVTPSDGLGDPLTLLTSGETLLDAIQMICQGSGLGFKTAFDPAYGTMRFGLYEGLDRWQNGTMGPAALDPEYDNLTGLTAEESIKDYYNVVYVLGELDQSLGIIKKTVVDSSILSGQGRSTGLSRYEKVVRYSAQSVMDGASSAIGLPPGTTKSQIKLTDAQYMAAMNEFGTRRLRMSTQDMKLSGTLVLSSWPDITLGDIIRVRVRDMDVNMSARVRSLEIDIKNGFTSTFVTLGPV